MDPEWLQAVEMLRGFGPGSRFLVVGMAGSTPVRVEVHKAVPEAQAYIQKSTWKHRQDPEIHYSWVFAGIRFYYHADRETHLPYPPQKEER